METWPTGKTTIAITRDVSAALSACEVTFIERGAVDVELARAEHREYTEALRWAGLRVVQLPALDAHPDACFVEDTAVVLDEVAIMTSMGAQSRRGEVPSMEDALAEFREIQRLEPPATLEGGDVLRIARTLFVGRSSRTNDAGIAAVAGIAERHGYRVVVVEVTGCLHLKTACTAVTRDTVVVNPEWIDIRPFAGFRLEKVTADEPWGANVLAANGRAILHAAHERTAQMLSRHGVEVRGVNVGEFMKAEAGVTCLSVLLADEG